MSGLGKIDVEDWKMNTRLKHCTPDSNVVKWFWAIVDAFDEEKRARLLQFVTGSCRVPLQVGYVCRSYIINNNYVNWIIYCLQKVFISNTIL